MQEYWNHTNKAINMFMWPFLLIEKLKDLTFSRIRYLYAELFSGVN